MKLSAQAAAVVRHHIETTRKAAKLAHGWRELPAFVFYAAVEPAPLTLDPHGFPVPTGTLDPHNVRRAMRSILRTLAAEDVRAKLAPADHFPQHFTPHGLRHTYASIRISKGDSIKDVQEQLGHEGLRADCEHVRLVAPERRHRHHRPPRRRRQEHRGRSLERGKW